MKTDPSPSAENSAASVTRTDSSKLLSLLALAAGAAAMPQTSQADVVFTDLSTNNVTVGPTAMASFLLDNLPGTARIAFQAFHKATTLVPQGSSRWVNVAKAAGYARFASHSSFVLPLGPGKTWNQIVTSRHLIAVSTTFGAVAAANSAGGRTPSSFDHRYLLFKIKDSTLPNSPLRYGWIDVSVSNPVTGTNGPLVTVWGYAYDTTGATLATGAVPEPAPVALLALGALTLGASGLRAWRKQRPAQSES